MIAALDVADDVAAEAGEHPPGAAATVAALAIGVNVDFSVALDDNFVVVGIFKEVFANLAVGDGSFHGLILVGVAGWNRRGIRLQGGWLA